MDEKLLVLINRDWTSPAADRFMAVMSSFDFWIPVFFVAILVLAIRGGFHSRAFLILIAAVIGINDGLIVNPMKHWIARGRPHEVREGVRQVDLAKARPRLLAVAQPAVVKLSPKPKEDVNGRSFPSGHTVDTVSGAMVAALFWPRRGWIAFLIPLLVGYSRIYTGSHWPSDVIASLFLGAGLSLVWLTAAEWWWRRSGGRFFPHARAEHPSLFPAA